MCISCFIHTVNKNTFHLINITFRCADNGKVCLERKCIVLGFSHIGTSNSLQLINGTTKPCDLETKDNTQQTIFAPMHHFHYQQRNYKETHAVT